MPRWERTEASEKLEKGKFVEMEEGIEVGTETNIGLQKKENPQFLKTAGFEGMAGERDLVGGEPRNLQTHVTNLVLHFL